MARLIPGIGIVKDNPAQLVPGAGVVKDANEGSTSFLVLGAGVVSILPEQQRLVPGAGLFDATVWGSSGSADATGTGLGGTVTLSAIAGAALATQRLYRYPDAILAVVRLAGDHTRIDESPDSPDVNWLTFEPSG